MAELSKTQDQPKFTNQLRSILRNVSAIYIVVILLLLAVGYLNPNFLRPQGVLALLRRAAPLMILTAGQMFVIASGGLDLSTGSTVTLVVIGAALLIDNDPANTWWVIPVFLGVGVVIGAINGVIVAHAKVPSLIATLGTLLAIRGVGLYVSGGAPRGYLTDNFRFFGRGFIDNVPVIDRFPVAVIVLVVVGIIGTYILHGTNYGRQVLALGDNPRAAKLSGVNTNRVRVLAFVLSSVFAIIAGILLGGFAGVNVEAGTGLELQAISAAVLGGAILLGGGGSMPAAMAGSLALELLFTMLNLLGLPKPLRDVVQGLIIIGAVAYSAIRTRRRT